MAVNVTDPIILALDLEASFATFLTNIGMQASERACLHREGFTTMQELLSAYLDTDQLKKLIVNLNKTFGSTTGNNRAYFPTTVTRRLCGAHWFLNICVSGMDMVPDISAIDRNTSNEYASSYDSWTTKKTRLNEMEVKVPKFTQENWSLFKERFVNLCQLRIGCRDIPLDYVLAKSDNLDNGLKIIPGGIDVDTGLISKSVTHYGDKFTSDSELVFTMLAKELKDTPGWNHINKHKRRKAGRDAWKSLVVHYEGRQYVLNTRTAAYSRLRNSSFKGESPNFSFKRYINMHMIAHKELEDIGHPNPNGLDDSTKIQYFIDGIKSQAHLETILAVACNNPAYENNFDAFVNFVGSEVVRTKTRRGAQGSGNSRNVNAINSGNTGKGGRNYNRNRSDNHKTNDKPADGIKVDGRWLTNKYYPDFNSLTQKQKKAVINLKKNPSNTGNGKTDSRTIQGARTEDDTLTVGESRSICSSLSRIETALLNGATQASRDNEDNPQSPREAGSRAPVGSVGGILMNRRGKRQKQE